MPDTLTRYPISRRGFLAAGAMLVDTVGLGRVKRIPVRYGYLVRQDIGPELSADGSELNISHPNKPASDESQKCSSNGGDEGFVLANGNESASQTDRFGDGVRSFLLLCSGIACGLFGFALLIRGRFLP